MLLVGGVDRPVVDAVVSSLDAHDLRPWHLEDEDRRPESLFQRLFESRSDFVFIDSVSRLGTRPQPSALHEVVRCAAAAGVRKLIVVTSRASNDPALAALRRSGAPYDILQVERLIDVDAETTARLLSSPRVILSRELLSHASGGVVMADIAEAVVRSVRSDDAGVTMKVEPGAGDRSLMTLLQQFGGETQRWWRAGRPLEAPRQATA